MPHLTLEISAGGPILDIAVCVSNARANAMHAAGQVPRSPIQVRGLVDTGASFTFIDPTVFERLGIPPSGTTPIRTPSTGQQPHIAHVYDVNLVLMHPSLGYQFQNVPVAACELQIQGIQALIGRDVLRMCLFIYDGQSGRFTLGF
jgi:predicted aspartyl protease